ncbi:MAG: hypothetical protein DHS20C18_05100 [Saprospiraceae bacterium]|nr:MAG: hypothetical protein DHS20C18_05100 [Saprospiraceae bacterium]
MAGNKFDLIVIGAGPAGSTLVSYLKASGYSIAVIDKSTFPRDKVCGDAIPGRAVRILEAISPETQHRFAQFQAKRQTKGGTAFAPKGAAFSLYFKTRGYISKRIDFDYFLYQEARLNTDATYFLEENVQSIKMEEEQVRVQLKGQEKPLTGKLILGCDGANSIVARKLAGRTVDAAHHCGAVRAYFKNVCLEDNFMMEFHLLKGYLPGYFWIFPLENDLYNVGFGMLSKEISARKINLRESLQGIIKQVPTLRKAFNNAEQIGDIEGFGLPLGSVKRSISGHRFMLCGDAASLIDPATGEGIGNALLSARLAVEQIQLCFNADRFDAKFMKTYDRKVYEKLWKELKGKYLIQRLLKDRSWLLDWSIRLAANFPILGRVVGKFI